MAKVLCIGGDSDGDFIDWPDGELHHGARRIVMKALPMPSRRDIPEFSRIERSTEAYYIHEYRGGEGRVYFAATSDYDPLTVITTLAENYANKNERY